MWHWVPSPAHTPEEKPCLLLLLEIPALAASGQTLKFQSWRTLGFRRNPSFWSPVQQTVQLLLRTVLYIQAQTPQLWQGFFKAVSHHTDILQSWGILQNGIAARALAALEIQDAGFYFFEIPFELLIPQCKCDPSRWILHKLCLVSAQWAIQGRYKRHKLWAKQGHLHRERYPQKF